MDQELLPLSAAKTRLHEVIRDAEGRDVILLRHGRPVGVLLGYRRYLALLADARRARAGSMGGSAILDAHRDEIGAICERHRVRQLSVFGSAARGEDAASSDLDLLVELSPMSPGERADAFFGLQADLEGLLGRTVDLLEESAIRNPFLREAIDRDRTVVYDAA
jgi:prevent-host-death family protein